MLSIRINSLLFATALVTSAAVAQSQTGASTSASDGSAFAAPVSADQLAMQQRDHFIQEADATVDNAKDVAQMLDAGLKEGGIRVNQRENLQKLQDRISEAESRTLELKSVSVENMSAAFAGARQAYDELQDAYFPVAALFDLARKKEEQQIQAQLSHLQKSRQNLETASGAAKLPPQLRDDVKKAMGAIDGTVKSGRDMLARLQKSNGRRWSGLRSDVDNVVDRTEGRFYETLRKLTARG